MTANKPFTMIAATLLGLMALLHAYRLLTDFQVIVGSHAIPVGASWIAMIVSGGLSFMLFREGAR